MKKLLVRGLPCLFMSLLFHFFLFFFMFSNVSLLPVQSAPQERKILAEVMLIAPRREGESEGRNSASEKNLEKIEESKPKTQMQENKQNEQMQESKPKVQIQESVPAIQIQEEVNKINEAREVVTEVKKTIKPRKSIASKQVKPTVKAAPQKVATENKISDAHEINIDNNRAGNNRIDNNNESSSRASYSENISPKPGVAENSNSQARAHSLIAAVDSVIVVNRVKPVYPQISRKRGEEGNVVLLASVKNGKVVDVTIEKSSGIKALDSSALTAVGKWSFSADTSIVVRIPVSFRLKD